MFMKIKIYFYSVMFGRTLCVTFDFTFEFSHVQFFSHYQTLHYLLQLPSSHAPTLHFHGFTRSR
ncbi:hypothetical protein LDENG_00126440, partial [Lucifuga dentata]